MADPISSIPGVASGIDWASVVDQMITIQKRPSTRLQSTIDANTKKKEALETLRQKMAAVQSAADGLRNGKALDAFAITATGTDASGRTVLAATVGTAGIPGTYDVNVTSLATAQKTIAASGWTGTRTLTADATLKLGGQPVDLVAGDSLATIRDRINAQLEKTGVQASIVSTDAAGTDQRLVLTSQKLGAANAFTVADGSNGALVAALGFDGTNAVPAADARFTMDGGATTITRPTNVIADAIPGVTLTLTAKGASAITVDRQPLAGVNAMQAFVDAYNEMQTFAKAQAASGGTLRNDSLARGIRGALGNITLAEAARVDDAGQPTAVVDDMTALNALGVTVQKDGSLALDKTRFNEIYPSRMNDVRAVLHDRMTTFFRYADSITGTYTGEIDKRESAMQTQNASMALRIDEITSRLDKQRSALLARYAKFEASLAKMKSVGDAMTAQFTAMNASKNT